MSSDVITCREQDCYVQFAGGNDEQAEAARVRHEQVVHGAIFKRPTEPGAPFQRHSVTSLTASQEIRAHTRVLRERVYEYIKHRGPATDQQIQNALDMDPSTERPRRRELEQAGRVRDSGRTAKTYAGRAAVLWEAK